MISVSIVTYNTPTRELLSIVDKCSAENFVGGICIIDNNSTVPLESLWFDNDKVTIIHNENTGYIAHNLGIRFFSQRKFKYHLILNSDIEFECGTLDQIYGIMEKNEGIGLLMPQIRYPNGDLQRVAKFLPNPISMFFRMLGITSICDIATPSVSNVPIFVPYLSGCFMFMNREHLDKCGYMDENFFMYAEDIDLSRRMANVALNVFYPDISLVHKHGKISKKVFKLFFIHILNLFKYFNKWGWWKDPNRVSLNSKCGAVIKIHT